MWLVLLACMFPMCGSMLCMHVLCVPTRSAHAYANLCTHACCLCVLYVCTCSFVCVPLDTCSLALCVRKYVRAVYCSDAVCMEFVHVAVALHMCVHTCVCVHVCACGCRALAGAEPGRGWRSRVQQAGRG